MGKKKRATGKEPTEPQPVPRDDPPVPDDEPEALAEDLFDPDVADDVVVEEDPARIESEPKTDPGDGIEKTGIDVELGETGVLEEPGAKEEPPPPEAAPAEKPVGTGTAGREGHAQEHASEHRREHG